MLTQNPGLEKDSVCLEKYSSVNSTDKTGCEGFKPGSVNYTEILNHRHN